ISKLIYLTTHIRPNIAFSVYNYARHISNLNKQHYNTVNRIFKYLNYTPTKGLLLKNNNNIIPNLIGYTDAD
ncbi:hypothetical protein K458DRAFT_310358, partial [Lentithecium fluviatile CBS 122367]